MIEGIDYPDPELVREGRLEYITTMGELPPTLYAEPVVNLQLDVMDLVMLGATIRGYIKHNQPMHGLKAATLQDLDARITEALVRTKARVDGITIPE